MHIPDELAEPLMSFIRLCRGARKGTRLNAVRQQLEEAYPELDKDQIDRVIRMGATKLTEQDKPAWSTNEDSGS